MIYPYLAMTRGDYKILETYARVPRVSHHDTFLLLTGSMPPECFEKWVMRGLIYQCIYGLLNSTCFSTYAIMEKQWITSGFKRCSVDCVIGEVEMWEVSGLSMLEEFLTLWLLR